MRPTVRNKANRTTVVSALFAAPLITALALASLPAAADTQRFRDDAMLEQARRAAAGPATTPLDVTVNIGRTPEEQQKLEQRRDAEIKDLIDRLKQAELARKSNGKDKTIAARPDTSVPSGGSWSTETVTAPPANFDTSKRTALGARPDHRDSGGDDAYTRGRATILLVMNRETARSRRTSDPILCLEYGCYISSGPQAPAGFFNFNQAMGPFGRLGRGAGACDGTDVCVFRGVDLGLSGATLVQPVTLRMGRPDRRHLRDVVADNSCRMIAGQLNCSRPVRAEGYTLWAVPERLASRIGPEALEAAVMSGLVTGRTAELPWHSN